MTRVALPPDHGEALELEARKPLTKRERIALWNEQNGICGATGCETAIPYHGSAVIDEHLIPLGIGGKNALRNRALYCKSCATAKTAEDATTRAHVNRMRARHDGTAPPPTQAIRSRGFQRRWG